VDEALHYDVALAWLAIWKTRHGKVYICIARIQIKGQYSVPLHFHQKLALFGGMRDIDAL